MSQMPFQEKLALEMIHTMLNQLSYFSRESIFSELFLLIAVFQSDLLKSGCIESHERQSQTALLYFSLLSFCFNYFRVDEGEVILGFFIVMSSQCFAIDDGNFFNGGMKNKHSVDTLDLIGSQICDIVVSSCFFHGFELGHHLFIID